jgi:DNA-binding MarR family transcriptional regulator
MGLAVDRWAEERVNLELGQLQKEAFGALLMAHAALTRKIDRALSQSGCPSLQTYDVLLALEDAPEGRMRMSDLADAVVFDPSSLTRLVDRLESKGLVRREQHPKDRRSIYAVLTPAGLQARLDAWPTYRALIQEHFGSVLNDEGARSIRDLMFDILERLQTPISDRKSRMHSKAGVN